MWLGFQCWSVHVHFVLVGLTCGVQQSKLRVVSLSFIGENLGGSKSHAHEWRKGRSLVSNFHCSPVLKFDQGGMVAGVLIGGGVNCSRK